MNVATIEMPRREAKARLKDYRAALHRTADDEYEQAALAYSQLARGLRLVNLREAFAVAPVDAQGRPRIAIARADRNQVQLSRSPGDRNLVFDSRWRAWRSRPARGIRISIEMPEAAEKYACGYALVPMTPPKERGRHDMEKCFILWEVEKWADKEIGARPDRDPYLLRHVSGDLYAILAEWDLTEVERAVMAGRANNPN